MLGRGDKCRSHLSTFYPVTVQLLRHPCPIHLLLQKDDLRHMDKIQFESTHLSQTQAHHLLWLGDTQMESGENTCLQLIFELIREFKEVLRLIFTSHTQRFENILLLMNFSDDFFVLGRVEIGHLSTFTHYPLSIYIVVA